MSEEPKEINKNSANVIYLNLFVYIEIAPVIAEALSMNFLMNKKMKINAMMVPLVINKTLESLKSALADFNFNVPPWF